MNNDTETMRRGATDAETCRLNGWDVGTELVGDQGYGPSTIVITAIGERQILARCTHHGDGRIHGERTWTLTAREWSEVAR